MLRTGGFHHFLGARDLARGVAMHGEEGTALLEATLAARGFDLRNAQADERAGQAADGSTNSEARQPGHGRPGGQDRSEAGKPASASAIAHTPPSGTGASCALVHTARAPPRAMLEVAGCGQRRGA